MKKTKRWEVFILFLLAIVPTYLGTTSAIEWWNLGKQDSTTHKVWMPNHTTISKTEADKPEKGNQNQEFISLENYKRIPPEVKHKVGILKTSVLYTSVYGDMVLASKDRYVYPKASQITRVTYLGDGVVEIKLARNWLATIINPLLAFAVGIVIDVVIVIVVVIGVIIGFIGFCIIKEICKKRKKFSTPLK